MATIILHLGMHKTGTSSIQSGFRAYDDGTMRYLRLGAPNHSKAVRAIFKNTPEDNSSYRTRGYTQEMIEAERASLQRRLEEELALERDTYIVSGEGFLSFDESEARKLKAYLEARGLEPRLIAYVREPIGFASSSFQQRVKGGLDQFALAPVNYRRRFEQFVTVFGGDLEFIAFSRDAFRGGSVVQDFAARIGADMAAIDEDTANESLPAAAVALLFFWNREPASAMGSRQSVAARRRLNEALAGHFEERFRISTAAILAALDRDDIAWMEKVAGLSLLPSDAAAAHDTRGVASEDDLRALCEESLPALATLLERHGLPVPARRNANAMMTRLYRAFLQEARKAA